MYALDEKDLLDSGTRQPILFAHPAIRNSRHNVPLRALKLLKLRSAVCDTKDVMKRILLIEDSPDSVLLVKQTLGSAYHIVTVARASEALAEAGKASFDLIVLDIALPDGNGLKLCAELHNQNSTHNNVPIVFLAGKGQAADMVMGFSLGGDEYIVKPFEPVEFRVRVAAKLERMRVTAETEEILRMGDIQINMAKLEASVLNGNGGIDLMLTPIEFKLLSYFIHHVDHVLTREQLLIAVWGGSVHVQTRTIDKHVSSLRHKLGARSHSIEAVHGAGYKFSPTSAAKHLAAA